VEKMQKNNTYVKVNRVPIAHGSKGNATWGYVEFHFVSHLFALKMYQKKYIYEETNGYYVFSNLFMCFLCDFKNVRQSKYSPSLSGSEHFTEGQKQLHMYIHCSKRPRFS
jgi:hypothetical protein